MVAMEEGSPADRQEQQRKDECSFGRSGLDTKVSADWEFAYRSGSPGVSN